MLPTLLLGAALFAATPAAPPAPDLDEYEAARSQVRRNPEGHIKLALWCEVHGLSAEAAKHLALAVLTDPENARARGLMGLVDFGGRWRRPEAVGAMRGGRRGAVGETGRVQRRRGRAAGTADSHWRLALWCEEVGLDAEAQAHLSCTVRLDPGREAAWKRLGFKKHNGRGSPTHNWPRRRRRPRPGRRPISTGGRSWANGAGWLGDKARRSEAEDALAKVEDPRAVPAVCAVFAGGDATCQVLAVQLLGQINAPDASRALAMLAVFGRSAQPRRPAAETLRRRDLRDFMDLLIGLLRKPIKYKVRPGRRPGDAGGIVRRGRALRRPTGLWSEPQPGPPGPRPDVRRLRPVRPLLRREPLGMATTRSGERHARDRPGLPRITAGPSDVRCLGDGARGGTCRSPRPWSGSNRWSR